MLNEELLRSTFATMIHDIQAPPVPLPEIRARIDRLAVKPRVASSSLGFGAAAAALIVFAICLFPAATLGLVETVIVAGYDAAHRLIGWTPPSVPVPKVLESQIASQSGTFAAAQSRANFTIVPPAGIPRDARLNQIKTTLTMVFAKNARSWSKGPAVVTFSYRRSEGHLFSLMAEAYDPRTGPPPKYIFLAKDLPSGRVALTKYAHFAWRNGDQVMSVTSDENINAEEIGAIESAMHGVPLAEADPADRRTGTVVKKYYLTGP